MTIGGDASSALPAGTSLCRERTSSSRTVLALACAALSGAAAIRAFLSDAEPLLPFVALAPLMLVMDERRPLRSIAACGVVGAFLGFGLTSWLRAGLIRGGGTSPGVAAAITLAWGAWESLRLPAMGVLWVLARRARLPLSVAWFGAVLTCELFYPSPVPWYLGLAITRPLEALQIADLLGPEGLTVVVVASNLAVSRMIALRFPAKRTVVRDLAVCTGICAALLAYGFVRLHEISDRSRRAVHARVGLAQVSAGPDAFGPRTTQSMLDVVRRNVQVTWDLRDSGAEFVVWSESAIAAAVPRYDVDRLYPLLFSRDLGVASIVGAALYRGASAATPRAFSNAAIAMDEKGTVTGVYEKHVLAPLGEDPGWLGKLDGVVPGRVEMVRGSDSGPITIGGRPVTTVICFEDLLTDYVRKAVSQGEGEAIVTLVNDGWFAGTVQPRLHARMARLRAIENRRYFVRASTVGPSELVEPTGSISSSFPEGSEGPLLGTIAWMKDKTVYSRHGDRPLRALAGCFAAWLLVAGRRAFYSSIPSSLSLFKNVG